MPVAVISPSAPPLSRPWQLAQLTLLSPESWGSKNSRRPNAILSISVSDVAMIG
jgi:hypothetical protein